MTLPLTPQMLRAAYEYLRTTPPFNRWRLPHGEEVEFCVIRSPLVWGDHTTYKETDKHVIRVSSSVVGYTQSLMTAMAHEMIHARQAVTKTATRAEHNKEWFALRRQVCKYHGFDPKNL